MKTKLIVLACFLWSCAKEEVYVKNNNLFIVSSNNVLYEIDPKTLKVDSVVFDLTPAQSNHISRSEDGKMLSWALPETYIGVGGHSHGGSSDGLSGGVLIYDLVSKKIKKRIRLPKPNYNAVFTSNGLYTATYTTIGTLYGFNMAFEAVLETYIGDEPTQLSAIKGSDMLAVALSHNTFIKFFSTATNTSLTSTKVSNFPLNAWAGTKHVYIQNSSNIIDVIDSQTKAGLWSGSVSSAPGRIVELSNGLIAVAFPNEAKLSFYTFQNNALTLVKSTPKVEDPHAMVEKDGVLWIVSKKTGVLTLVSLETFSIIKSVYVGKQINDLTF